METKYNGETYKGILEITINTFRVLRMSNDSARIIAVVQNEDCLEYWLLDTLNFLEAMRELVRYYLTEEPWADFPGMMFFVAAQEASLNFALGAMCAELVAEGKLVMNEKQGRLTVPPVKS